MSDEKTPYPVQPAPLMPPPQPNQYDAQPSASYSTQQNYPPNYTQPSYVQPTLMVQPSVIVQPPVMLQPSVIFNSGLPRLTTSPQHLSKYLRARLGFLFHDFVFISYLFCQACPTCRAQIITKVDHRTCSGG
jgi:hypothetical protein